MDIYVLVIGSEPNLMMKKFSDKFKSFKECNWLYNGVLLQEDFTVSELIEQIGLNKKFFPQALIDNGHWLESKMVGSQENWEKSLAQCLNMTNQRHEISVFHCLM